MRLRSAFRALRRLGRRSLSESLAVTLAFFGGLALFAYGCALVFLPAGVIAGGILLAFGAALYARRAEG